MTKMIKMSLIAAVAVTGITSTVSAQPLEEAIKGVDVSGMLRYRYNDQNNGEVKSAYTAVTSPAKSIQGNEYVMEINTKSKVNDIITANVSVVAQGVNAESDNGKSSYYSAQTTDDTTGDVDVTLVVEQANFSANLGFATVIAGKQNIPGPFVDAVDITRQGTGAVALIPVGGLTIAAGHFVNHDISGVQGENATELALIGKVADVSADIWYADVTDVLSAYSLHANATVAGVNVDARHSSLEMDGGDTATLTKLVASGKVSDISLVAGYATTGSDNATSRIAIDKDNDAATDFRLWQLSAGALSDTTAFLVGAGMDVMPNVNLDAKYLMVDIDGTDASELLVGATYKMSKNFSAHVRYSMAEVDTLETDMGRLELKYTF